MWNVESKPVVIVAWNTFRLLLLQSLWGFPSDHLEMEKKRENTCRVSIS